MLDFRMDTFLTVCRYMNFTRAAEELHITQPGVSKHIRQLEEVSLTSLSSLTAKSGNKTYDIAENAQVLLRGSGRTGYYAATLSEINAEDFSLKGWYDNFGYPAGGEIRIIVAQEK